MNNHLAVDECGLHVCGQSQDERAAVFQAHELLLNQLSAHNSLHDHKMAVEIGYGITIVQELGQLTIPKVNRDEEQ